MLVVDNSDRIWAVAERTRDAGYRRTHCIGAVCPWNAGDQHIGTLADSQGYHLRRVWNDGHKVIGNDRQIVTIDTKLLYSLCSCVDQAQTMDFARTEPEVGDSCVVAALCLITGGYLGAVEVVSALDQIVVG
jgi:hypothetical protein